MKRFIESFQYALSGLRYVWREERNFRIQVIIAILVIFGLFLLDITPEMIGLVIIAIALVLTAETINTAFEDTLNKIEPQKDPTIGRIKDIAAGVVVLCVIGAVAIGILVFISYFSL